MPCPHDDAAEQDHVAEPCEDCGSCTLCGCDCEPPSEDAPDAWDGGFAENH